MNMDFNTLLKYFTVAAWLRGYADGMEEEDKDGHHAPLIKHLRAAADLLQAIWDDKDAKDKQP